MNIISIIICISLVSQVSTGQQVDSKIDLLGKSLLNAEDTETMWQAAEVLSSYRNKAIPYFEEAIQKWISQRYLLLNCARMDVAVVYLHKLAQDGCYQISEVPILILALKKCVIVKGSIKIADTLKLITGLDTGYTEEFTNAYTQEMESKRLEMIERWNKWYIDKLKKQNENQ